MAGVSPTSAFSSSCNLPTVFIFCVTKSCLLVPYASPESPRPAASYSARISLSKRATSEPCFWALFIRLPSFLYLFSCPFFWAALDHLLKELGVKRISELIVHDPELPYRLHQGLSGFLILLRDFGQQRLLHVLSLLFMRLTR